MGVSARVAHVSGQPEVHATIDLAPTTFDVPSLGREPVTVSGGRIQIDDRLLRLRDIPVRLGDQVSITVGSKGGPPGVAVLDSQNGWGIARLDLPLLGDLRAFDMSGLRIDRASFALRLQEQPRGSRLLTGDIDVADARVPANMGGGGQGSAQSPSKASSSPFGPELERMRLDLRVHSRPGGIEVNVRHAPDLHVGVDYRVGGTLKNPDVSGQVRGAGAYSVFMLWLARLMKQI
jgi:hypothetical protein